MQGTLYPYLIVRGDDATWVFDDPTKQLKAEAFVLGMSEMISRIVATNRIPEAADGFALTFGDEPMADADVELHWERKGRIEFEHQGKKHQILVGNWYSGMVAGQPMEGWLCPALLKYFPEAPVNIYAKAAPLPAGVDPIWHNPPEDLLKKAFVEAGDVPEYDHNYKWWEDPAFQWDAA